MWFSPSQDDQHEEGLPLTEGEWQEDEENEIEVNQSRYITLSPIDEQTKTT